MDYDTFCSLLRGLAILFIVTILYWLFILIPAHADPIDDARNAALATYPPRIYIKAAQADSDLPTPLASKPAAGPWQSSPDKTGDVEYVRIDVVERMLFRTLSGKSLSITQKDE